MQWVVLRPLPLGADGDRHHGLANQVDLVDPAQFLDNDFVSQFHVGGTQEYIGWAHGRVVLITPSSWFKLVPVVFVFLLVYYLRKHLSFLKSE